MGYKFTFSYHSFHLSSQWDRLQLGELKSWLAQSGGANRVRKLAMRARNKRIRFVAGKIIVFPKAKRSLCSSSSPCAHFARRSPGANFQQEIPTGHYLIPYIHILCNRFCNGFSLPNMGPKYRIKYLCQDSLNPSILRDLYTCQPSLTYQTSSSRIKTRKN